MNIPTISIPFFFSGLVLLTLSVYAIRKKSATGALAFGLFMLALSIYSLGYAFEITAIDLASMLFWSKIQYIGILTFPALFLIFIYQYTGRSDWVNPRTIALLFSPAVLLMLVKLFDENLHWIYRSTWAVEINSWTLLSFINGPLYSYVSMYQVFTVTLALILLWQGRRFASELFLRQSALMLAFGSIVYFMYFTYLLNIDLHPLLEGIDINPLAFFFLAIGSSLAIFRHGFLDLTPVARDLLIETLNDGVVVLDPQGRIVDFNPRAQEIFAWAEAPFGLSADTLISSHLDKKFLNELKEPWVDEIEITSGFENLTFEMTLSPVSDASRSELGFLVNIHDITARKKNEEKLKELTLADDLTGLNNRRGFRLLGEQLLVTARRMHLNAFLFYSDFDGLKHINDTLGHAEGDRALEDAAAVFRKSFRSSDIIARIGGDEFVLLGFESVDSSSDLIMDRLEENISKHRLLGRPYELSISTGMVQFEWQKPKTLSELLKEADRAMYMVKQSKKQRAQIAS